MDLQRLLHPREQAQESLYTQLCHFVAGKGTTEVICGAVINLMITLVHRGSRDQREAEARWDDLCGQGKELLKGRFQKRSVSPRSAE